MQIIAKHTLHISATNHATGTWVLTAANVEVALVDIGVLVSTFAQGEPVLRITVKEEFDPIHSAEHFSDVVALVTHTIESTHNASHAGSHHHVDRDSRLFNHL